MIINSIQIAPDFLYSDDTQIAVSFVNHRFQLISLAELSDLLICHECLPYAYTQAISLLVSSAEMC